jgi:Na+/H+-dicarboxylate symporter
VLISLSSWYFGPQLFGAYAKPLGLYYGVCAFTLWYFFSFYAFIAGGTNGLKVLSNNITPALTALGTCSSIATIPANLEATERCTYQHILETAIPLGAPLHKDGSSMSSIIKIAVIFYVRKDFTDPHTLLIALGITIIVSVVEGGIPNGGYIGRFWQSLFMVFNGTGFAGSHDCGNFSGSDGNIVKCEWRRSFSDVDYEFRKEGGFQTR